MKDIKSLLLIIVSVLAISEVASAGFFSRRPNPPSYPGGGGGYPGRGGVTCQANDRGHEEHWGGHGSCGQCLAVHGECIETCERIYEQHSCLFQGIDQGGRAIQFSGFGQTRREAQYNAQRSCQQAGFYNCQYLNCNVSQDRQVVSRNQCRR